MIKIAGFKGWEWFSEFQLDFRNGQPGAYHAVIRAWNTLERPALLDNTDQPANESTKKIVVEDPEMQHLRTLVHTYEKMNCIQVEDAELQHLRTLVNSYEKSRYLQFLRWLHPYRQKLATWIKPWTKTTKA
jgi:hypothetical protein